ncbi:MAG: hypothetical protein ACYDCQ_17640 [Dehalococcoidia bacterium]
MADYTLRIMFRTGQLMELSLSDEWVEEIEVAQTVLEGVGDGSGWVKAYGLSIDLREVAAAAFLDPDGSPTDPSSLFAEETDPDQPAAQP